MVLKVSELTQAQDRIEELKVELHEEKCRRIDALNKIGAENVAEKDRANKAVEELRASERFREHARQRCIYLEKVIKILLDKGNYDV